MVNGTTVAPKPGLPYLHLHESAFAEAGANGLDRSRGARSTDSLQPYIAVSVAQTFMAPEGAQYSQSCASATAARSYQQPSAHECRALALAAYTLLRRFPTAIDC